MKPLDRILQTAKAAPRHIVLAEGEDLRIVEGAVRASRAGIARITLVGDRKAVEARLAAAGIKAEQSGRCTSIQRVQYDADRTRSPFV